MTRGALVIRTYGDPEIAGAIVDGMTRRVISLDADELAVVKAELARLRARHNVRKYREDRDWHLVQMELQQKYGTKPRSTMYYNALIIWTVSSLFVIECFRRLRMRIKGARR